MKICFDEWNVWDERKGNSKNGLEQWYDYTDMLGFVAWLHVLVRQSKDVAIACLAQSVNVVRHSVRVVSEGRCQWEEDAGCPCRETRCVEQDRGRVKV